MSALVDKGLSALDSVVEVSSAADVVITSLPSFQALTSVVQELCQNPKHGQVLIECSTLTIEQKITAQITQGCRNGPPRCAYQRDTIDVV